MPNRENLTKKQEEDAARLKAIYNDAKPKLNLTHKRLGKMIGISGAGVGHYLNGTVALNLNIILKFARALMCKPSDIRPSIGEMGIELDTSNQVLLEKYLRLPPEEQENVRHLIDRILESR